jgi:peptide/nickel transport system permease protein
MRGSKSVGKYIARRLFFGIPIVLGVTLVTFILFHVFGGDPVSQFLGKNATAADLEALRKEYGLDRPLLAQYFEYLGQILRLDFGRSFVTRQPVMSMLARGVGPTLSLTVPAVLAITVIAVCTGLLAAYFRGRPVDRLLIVLAVIGMSVSFLVYIVFGQYLLAFRWPLFHIHGYEESFVGRWAYLALPMIILVVVSTGFEARFYRAVMVEEAEKDYVVTGIAKGLSRTRVLFRHVLPNAAVPIITQVMISVPFLVTGSLLLESFFGIPGLGGILLESIDRADFPVIKACTVLISIVFVLTNIATDVLYAIFDPRVRLS